MLNPFAHEFKPPNSLQPQLVQTKRTVATVNKAARDELAPQKQQQKKQRNSRPAATTKESHSINEMKVSKNKLKADTSSAVSTEASKKTAKDTPSKKTGSQQQTRTVSSSSKKPQQRPRRKSSQQQGTTSATTGFIAATNVVTDPFSEESKFITIEAAIDPIHRIDVRSKSAASSSISNNTVTSERYQFEHGYERYIKWIDKSLRKYDTVTVVGMDNAVVDIVSLLTILYDRKIGLHDDIETFSMKTGNNNRIAACIQAKLHPYY